MSSKNITLTLCKASDTEHKTCMCFLRQIEALKFRLAAAKKIDELLCFSDRVYDVREREGKGWDGRDVKAYIQACTDFNNEFPDPL